MMIEDLVVRLRQHEADEQTMEPCYNGLRDEAAFTLERMVRVLALVYGHLWHEETTHARRAIKQCLSVEQCRQGIKESREIYGTQDGERMDGRPGPLDLPREITYTHACIGVGCLKCLCKRAEIEIERLRALNGRLAAKLMKIAEQEDYK